MPEKQSPASISASKRGTHSLIKRSKCFWSHNSTPGKYILFIEAQRMLSSLLDFYIGMSIDKSYKTNKIVNFVKMWT